MKVGDEVGHWQNAKLGVHRTAVVIRKGIEEDYGCFIARNREGKEFPIWEGQYYVVKTAEERVAEKLMEMPS